MSEQNLDLVETSFQNVIHYYRAELLEIQKGVLSKNVLTSSEKRRLRIYGVLAPNGQLTARATELLRGVVENG